MTKRKILIILSIVVCILTIVFGLKKIMHMTCWVGDYRCRFNMPKQEVYIVDYRGDGDVVLPKKILFCDVIGYKSEVFKEDENIKTVFISNNPQDDISTIFHGCNNLTKVTYEEGTKVSYDYYFAGCGKLNTVNFPEGIEYLYGDGAFAGTNISDVYIPSSVKHMDSFFSNTPFAEKHKDDKYYVAGEGVLVFYNGPQDEIVIPKGVTCVGEGVLDIYNRADNASIYMSDSVKTMDLILRDDDTLYLGNGEYDLGYIKTYHGTIVAPEGSYMEQFCKENNLNFRVMTEEEEATWREKTEAAASEIVYQD